MPLQEVGWETFIRASKKKIYNSEKTEKRRHTGRGAADTLAICGANGTLYKRIFMRERRRRGGTGSYKLPDLRESERDQRVNNKKGCQKGARKVLLSTGGVAISAVGRPINTVMKNTKSRLMKESGKTIATGEYAERGRLEAGLLT